MIGLYFLAAIGLWLLLTIWLFLRGWHFYRTIAAPRLRWSGPFVVVAMAWLAVSFWYAGGRKLYYDMEVQRLCAIDGGVKVYEQVTLPAEQFDKWGMVAPYSPDRGENALGPAYVFRHEIADLRLGIPRVSRSRYLVIRRQDNKLLGETILYGRGGGDLPGPWHGSSYKCPKIAIAGPNALLRSVFTQNDAKTGD